MQANIVAFVGRGSLSGKTSVIEKVIAALKQRGKTVAAVKHGVHLQLPDKEGKDTYRFALAGADRIMMFSDAGMFLYENQAPDLDYLIGLAAHGVDLVIVEGFKRGPFKKIEVFNHQVYQTPLCVEQPGSDFIAVVSDLALEVDIPRFTFDDIAGICDFILSQTGGR